MSSAPFLPLQDIVDVVVQVNSGIASPPSFDQGLIVGNSGVIPTSGANSRIRQYSSLAGILADGFSTSSSEYLAAALFFSQQPAAQFLWVGAQDPSGINAVIPHAAAGGTGYALNDLIVPTQGGGSGATLKVTGVSSGVVTALAVVTAGHGYSVASALSTTGGSGSGLQVDITQIGESALLAVQACRAASAAWYAFTVTDAVDADHIALAAWAQTALPSVYYFYNTSDSAVLNNTTNNIAAQMKAALYRRVLGIYSTTQSGVAPNNAYIAAGAMGVAMGLNTGLANSFFTLKFKTIVGAIPEPLTESQKGVVEGLNVNLYLTYQNAYTFLEQGQEPSGAFFYQTLFLDMLIAFCQTNVMNLLVSSPAVPQTDPGEAQIINAVNNAAQALALIGFIAGGVWKGVTILNLSTGQTLPSGYIAQAQPYAVQSPSDKNARKAMPVYLSIIEAGAVHYVVIALLVQQ